MNLKTIADAIAATFVGITANGESIAVGPTASLPNAITKGPALLVYHPTGTLALRTSAWRDDFYDFPVKLLRDPLDVPARSDALYAWANAMRDQVETAVLLGMTGVEASTTAIRVELDGEKYADRIFDVVELTVSVHVFGHVATAAP
jgi:hypothetical protein